VADPDRIAARLQALWEIARGPAGGADRPAYSPAEAQAMALVAGWAAELALAPAIDRHGNLWALPPGAAPVITSGSHVDTVPDGGRYDGALGTVLGLELVADLAAAGESRAGLLVCAAEEAPRFGAGTVGSRLLAGALTDAALDDLHDDAGVSAHDARDGYLAALTDLPRVADPPTARVRAHAEIHVALRFGPPQLGVVTRVASPRRLEVAIDGESGHAGEVAMDERRDALAAAAEVVLAVERADGGDGLGGLGQGGTLALTPGAVSVIPGGARLGIDMRAIQDDSLDRLQHAVCVAVEEVARRRGVTAATTLTRTGSPVALDPGLAAAALQVARQRGIAAVSTWSGAGHDAQHISHFAPALLVFVPLHGGQSHTPQEGAQMDEILRAAEVVATVMGDVVRRM
jgi:hydantoinase/carbamoylase family amidase